MIERKVAFSHGNNRKTRNIFMYTVLLADDEPAVLDALTAGISWAQLGVDKILTAADGIQALDVLASSHVDLLITDIMMPRMDGLQLLTAVRSQYPEIHCILLSAYGEFEYARKALQLGVENYLLKPFQQDELERTIEKALDNLYDSRQNTARLFYNNILSLWVNDEIGNEELSERAGLMNINIFLNAYVVACIYKRKKACSSSALRDSILGRLGAGYEVYSFWDNKNRYVCILGKNNLDAAALTEAFVHTAMETQYKNNFAIALGPVVNSSEKVWQSYKTACSLLETTAHRASSCDIITQESVCLRHDAPLMEELRNLFYEETSEIRENGFRLLADRLQAQDRQNDAFSTLAQNLLLLFDQEFPNKPEIREQLGQRISLLSDAAEYPEPESALHSLLEYSCLAFRYHYGQLSPVIQNAIAYIHKHYADGLSIKEFCAKSKMNTTYLGYLFKKETGMFFNHYLNQYRICCASRLLLETDMQVNDIARSTGFSSTTYFVSSFKKQLGLSPIKYRSAKAAAD